MRPDREQLVRAVVVVAAALYLAITGWAMTAVSYDLWGAAIVAPVLAGLSIPLVRRLFEGQPWVVPIAFAGLALHMIGSLARYWVAFDAYGGSADAGRYHDVGSALAAQVRADWGQIGVVVPRPTGTPFIERLTGLVYTVAGSSRLAGFLVFGWMAYVGLCLYVRAASIAVRRLSQRRYAVLVLLLPSLVYWPSSIGKEAWMTLTLGAASYGIARLVSSQPFVPSVAIAAAGLVGAACVRPHVAAIWTVGGVAAAGVAAVARRGTDQRRSLGRTVAILMLGGLGALVVGRATLQYLDPGEDDEAATSERITDIFDMTEQRTTQGGSGFTPPSIESPADWPYAVARTLTRPLLHEATSLESLIPAVETTALVVLAALSLSRLRALPRMAVTVPYVAFAVVVTVLFGLAFTSIGNLGILARQRSQVLPLLVLPLCLWPLPTKPDVRPPERRVLVRA